MAKKKGKKTKRRQSSSRRGPFFAGHPLNGMPMEMKRRYVEEQVKAGREKYADLMPKLLHLVARVDPLHAIALMATYGLMGTPSEQGNHKSQGWTPKIQQGHIEYLQALCLRNPLDLSNSEFPEPPHIQQFFDWIPDIFQASQLLRHPGTGDEGEDPDARRSREAIASVQEFLRAHTSVVRNWGFFGHMARICKALFSRIDPDFEREFGLKLTTVVDIFEGLVRRHEDQMNEHRQKIHAIFQKSTKDELVTALFETFPLQGDLDGFRRQITASDVSMREARFRILPWTDRFVGPLLMIGCDEIAAAHGVAKDAVAILLNKLSLKFSNLADEAPEKFFLDNPVWLRPLIYCNAETFFSALPQSLMSFVHPIVDELIKPHPRLQKKLSEARAGFLEDEVFALFEKAFPNSQMSRGFKWREGAQQFESDLVIRYDSTILLVEAKSGKVSWPALRGAPARMVDHIKTLIVEPSDQSGRLAQRLQEDIDRVKAGEAPKLAFPLSMQGVTCVVRLSVSLHDFATLQSVPGLLAQADVLKNQYPLAPCVSLADLEIMLDLLETPHLRLHYLRRRAEFLLSIDAIGDELDMLGFYLDTGLNLGSMQSEKNTFLTLGYSTKIDRHYTLRDEGVESPKPQPSTSPWFKRLCDQLFERMRPGWSEIACALLSISPHDQSQLERQVRSMANRLRNSKVLKNGHDTICLIPPGWIKQALVFQVKRRDQPGYSADSPNIAQQAFEAVHVERCAVLVVDALDGDLPYLSAGVFMATEKNPNMAVFL